MNPQTDTAQNFTVKFSLTVTVEGSSLQDIDNGLVQAAGQRLAARMPNPPRLNGADVVARAPMPPTGANREEPRHTTPAPLAAAPQQPFDGGAAHPADGGFGGKVPGPDGSHQAGSDSGPGTVVHGGPADAGGAEPVAAGGSKGGRRGVKPGSTRGPYKKTAAEEAADAAAAQGAASPQPAAPSAPQAPVAPAPQAAPQVASPAQGGPVPTLDQCVAALTKVNTQKTTDIAYKCLTDMGVKRCGEIPEARRAEFIAKCEAAAAGV